MEQPADIFESALRAAGDLAGVFEYLDGSGYFYLFDEAAGDTQGIRSAVHVMSGPIDFASRDVSIRWDDDERRVRLLIRGVERAGFDSVTGEAWSTT